MGLASSIIGRFPSSFPSALIPALSDAALPAFPPKRKVATG